MDAGVVAYIALEEQVACCTPKRKRGDVVLEIQDGLPKGYWPLGPILQVFPGKHDRVGVAKVPVEKNPFTRPVTKACLLELD